MIIGNLVFQLPIRANRGELMSQKTMSEAKCTSCGRACTVPFKPTAGKPVYCRECLAKHRSEQPQAPVRSNAPIVIGKEAWAHRRNTGQAVREEATESVFHKFTQAS